MLLQQLIHEIAMLKPFRQVRHSDVLNWNNAKMVGIITIQSFEWCDLDGRVVACIIPIFNKESQEDHWEGQAWTKQRR